MHSPLARVLKFNALFQMDILISQGHFVQAMTCQAIQRSKLPKQHVIILPIVAVFMIIAVMVMNGLQLKAMTYPYLPNDLAHGLKVC